MSDSYSQNPSPSGSSLDLTGSTWVPTQPASTYIGPQPGDPGYQPATPEYGQPAPSQPLPAYGQSVAPEGQLASYGQSAPAYGQTTPAYGQPAPAYGQPTQAYGQPAPAYGQPTPTYGQPNPYNEQGYQVYGATPAPYAAAPYAYPAMGPMVPGQMVQTEFGPMVVGDKSKLAAGLLGIFLGSLGVGQFYRGNAVLGIVQLVVTIVTMGFGALWGFIEGIVVLCSKPGSPYSLDSTGRLMT